MSGGILGLGSLPQATGGGGILDNFSNMVGNNRDALMGLGAGLLSGQGWGAGMQGYLQGAQQDQRTRLIQQQQAELAQKKQAATAVATKLGVPELANDPDTALGLYKAVQLQKLSQSAPTEIQRNLAALGLQPGSDQYKSAYMKLAGLTKPTATWGVIRKDDYGNDVYGWIDPTAQSITPGPSQSSTMVGSLPGPSTGSPIPPPPPGADPKIWRQEQTKIEAEKDKQSPLPPDMAGRLALADSYLTNAPSIREKIKSGYLTGPIDGAMARNGIGERGEVYKDIQSGVDALQRGLTGAGMGPTEAQNYANRYLPTSTDDTSTLLRKHDRLVTELQGLRAKAYEGRGRSTPPIAGAQPSRADLEAEARRRGLIR